MSTTRTDVMIDDEVAIFCRDEGFDPIKARDGLRMVLDRTASLFGREKGIEAAHHVIGVIRAEKLYGRSYRYNDCGCYIGEVVRTFDSAMKLSSVFRIRGGRETSYLESLAYKILPANWDERHEKTMLPWSLYNKIRALLVQWTQEWLDEHEPTRP